MNNDVKIAKYYSPSKARRAIMLMEQFWLLSKDQTLEEKDRKCAFALHEHFKRLSLCIIAKQMPDQLVEDLVIDADYMKNMYKRYSE